MLICNIIACEILWKSFTKFLHLMSVVWQLV